MDHSSNTAARSWRDQVGLSIQQTDAPTLVGVIAEAEGAGVQQLWLTQTPFSTDSLTVFAAAMARTRTIRLGTSIIPVYPQHPLALAQQAATVAALAPGRLRLGVGTSHRSAIESVYGLPMDAPLDYLREYVEVLRAALWTGEVDHQGRFFTAKVKLPTRPQVPILVAALGEKAFRLAGALGGEGAISWNTPPAYLHNVALPALRQGAAERGGTPPPLVAHFWVSLHPDAAAVRAAAKKSLAVYTRLPFYTNMWAAAGFPLAPDGSAGDALLDQLVISGDETTVAARLADLLAGGLDELLLTGIYVGDVAAERSKMLRFIGGR
jgi:F420-dependent oxidoreductase-like protein